MSEDVWIGMEKETTGGRRWKFADGSDVPSYFQYEWQARNSVDAGADFMRLWCFRTSSDFGELYNLPNTRKLDFICQHQ